MAQPVRLKLNGKAFHLNQKRPMVIQIQTSLDKAPADEIYTQGELARIAGLSLHSIRGDTAQLIAILAAYTEKLGPKRYWGNPHAIAELRRQTAK